eukprot:scaffold27687_cov38-Phaeocystis_antarctica.AAC.3
MSRSMSATRSFIRPSVCISCTGGHKGTLRRPEAERRRATTPDTSNCGFPSTGLPQRPWVGSGRGGQATPSATGVPRGWQRTSLCARRVSMASQSFSQSVKASLADSEPVASFLADLKMPMLALLLRRTRVASAEGGGKGCGANDAPVEREA